MATTETQESPNISFIYGKFSFYALLLLAFGMAVGGASTYFAGASAGHFDATKVNAGDTGWVLTASALVMLMTPLVGVFYGGLVTSKNVVSLIKQSLVILAVISIQWVLFGYSLVFGHDFHGIIGELNFFGLNGVGYLPNADYAGTIPQLAFMIFQAMGAVIAPALILGSIAERMRFRTLVIFVLLWSTFVYDPIAHWVWGTGGWLHNMGALDFAGGAAVHASAGFSGLAAAIVIGKRRDFKIGVPIASHNVPLILLGAGVLWFGWLGFNGGSALAASPTGVNALVTTNTAGAAGALVWMILSWAENKKPSAIATAIGAVCGLIAITPASGYVGPMASIAIGTIAGLVTYMALYLRSKFFDIDDTLDVWAAHGMGGVTGLILTGVFAEKAIRNPLNDPTVLAADGLLFGNASQIGVQLLVAGVTLAYAFVMTVLLLKLLGPLGLRVSRQEEEQGLDLAIHGEEAYSQGAIQGMNQGVAEQRLAQLEARTAQLRLQMEMQSNELRSRLQNETGELRLQMQNESADLRQRLQIAHLESQNAELRRRLSESNGSDTRQHQDTYTSLRAYKQFVVPESTTRNLG
jgi:Amt family ammonium transporter